MKQFNGAALSLITETGTIPTNVIVSENFLHVAVGPTGREPLRIHSMSLRDACDRQAFPNDQGGGREEPLK